MINPCPTGHECHFSATLLENADTIEALRAENARLYEWKDKAGDMDRVKTVELVDLRAENARLTTDKERLQGAAVAFTKGNATLHAEIIALRAENARLAGDVLSNYDRFQRENHRCEKLRAENARLQRETVYGSNEWLHVKTGGLYEIVGECRIEATNTPAIIYRSKKDGTIWVRPRDEFYDGRFVNTARAAIGESDE